MQVKLESSEAEWIRFSKRKFWDNINFIKTKSLYIYTYKNHFILINFLYGKIKLKIYFIILLI